jgi:methionyl-tRNA formyltransferase
VRIVFLGTPESALPSLDAILNSGHDVPLVVTQPDRPSGRSNTPVFPPVKNAALSHGLQVVQPDKVRSSEFVRTIVAAGADALVVVAYGRILTRPVLDAARLGAINLHFSLLPAYRGAAPVQWALARGERVTGVTTFRLDDGIDTGSVLARRSVAIEAAERAPALLGRLAIEGASLLTETLDGLAEGAIVPEPQDEMQASLAPMLAREDGFFDPRWTGAELAGRVRGFDPWPGVWAECRGRRLRIVEAGVDAGRAEDAAPGTWLDLIGDSIRLACASGTVAAVSQVQPSGGRAMRARDAFNGRLLRTGDRLERPEPTA